MVAVAVATLVVAVATLAVAVATLAVAVATLVVAVATLVVAVASNNDHSIQRAARVCSHVTHARIAHHRRSRP